MRAKTETNSKTENLANYVARCNGVGFQENDGWDWREGCETCLRRTAARDEQVWMMDPPKIIAFECEFLISPNATAQIPPTKTKKL